MMKALSVKQPWAWLIVNGFKDIENRDWPHPPKYRGRILVHASKQIDPKMHNALLRFMVNAYEGCPGFAGLTAAQVKRFTETYPMNMEKWVHGVVGVVDIVDVVTRSPSAWFTGPLGFVLKNACPLPFIPMKGSLGLFNAEYPQELLDRLPAEVNLGQKQ